jgi:hypothetical protein
MRLDRYVNVSNHHQGSLDPHKAPEVRTLLENVAAINFIQQLDEVNQN